MLEKASSVKYVSTQKSYLQNQPLLDPNFVLYLLGINLLWEKNTNPNECGTE